MKNKWPFLVLIGVLFGCFLIEFSLIFPHTLVTGLTLTQCRAFGVNYHVLATHQYYRLVTAMFLYVNLMHFCFNMVWLLLLMWAYSTELPLSAKRVVWLIVIVALLGEIAFMVLDSMSSTVGMSGGLMAVTTFYLTYSFHNKEFNAKKFRYIAIFVTFFLLVFGDATGDTVSHVVGLVSGMAVGLYYRYYVPFMKQNT